MRTPLHWACFTGKKDIVELLLSKGADVNIKDNEGKIALHLAKTKEIAEMLVKKDSSVNAIDVNGKTPLFIACQYCRTRRSRVSCN
jgi:ankyrin repeat protein